jgi:hypothetical protein
MTKSEQFENLKAKALKDYEGYINAIDNFSFEDIHNLHKRLSFLDAYNRSVMSNTSYRNFINDTKNFVPSLKFAHPFLNP